MTVHLWDNKLSYISVPKCGCSSLKLFFHEVLTGAPFEASDQQKDIHQMYRSRRFSALPQKRIRDHLRVAVVRDPVTRFMSGYYGKVVGERCLERPLVRRVVQASGLPTRPDLETFLDHLGRYKLLSPVVFRHFQALSYFLGRNVSWFTRVFDISELGALRDFVRDVTGSKAEMPHVNRRHPGIDPEPLALNIKHRIAELYEEDTALFGGSFKIAA